MIVLVVEVIYLICIEYLRFFDVKLLPLDKFKMSELFLFRILILSACFAGLSMHSRQNKRKSKTSYLKNRVKRISTQIDDGKNINVTFLVCTRQHRTCVRCHQDEKTNILDPYKMTKLLIHGWRNDEQSPMPQTLKDAYLEYQDVNVIIVGWGKYANTLDYSYSVSMKVKISQCVTEFLLRNIRTTNPELALHMVGHSLGAHVCGHVGALLARRNFLVYRISGLDPASPLIVDGIRAKDAFFVDIIHTSAGTIGQWAPAGHIDFYPNGGMLPQPHCNILHPQCSHTYAWKLFEHSIRNGTRYLSVRCKSYAHFLIGKCQGVQYMGEEVSVHGRGTYYVDTTRS